MTRWAIVTASVLVALGAAVAVVRGLRARPEGAMPGDRPAAGEAAPRPGPAADATVVSRPAPVSPTALPAGVRKVVRPSALAGAWYEGSREALDNQVREFLAAAEAPREGGRRVGALIAPHAGYRYAGRSQGAAFRVLAGARYRRVIVLGPSHYAQFRGISVAPVTHYETPLGEVPLDLEAIAELERIPIFDPEVPARAHAREHSIEIELPFLQVVLGKFALVPILVGDLPSRDRAIVANALRPLLDEGTLVVASSDFTHYGERFGYEPFAPAERRRRLKELDLGAARLAREGDADAFARFLDETGATVCGGRPIAVLLSLLPAGFSSELLSYTTSAEVTGEEAESVSYVSIAFRFEPPLEDASPLSEEELRRLVAIARFSLERGVRTGAAPTEKDLRAAFPPTPRLERRRGAFVTLKIGGKLRGCMGAIFPESPLFIATAEMAVTAALRDPRFQPVSEAELKSIELEVSALTPPRPIPGPEAIRVGRDGVLLTKGRAGAVFLPQVATEQGWDLETMLSHLALKAGLPAEAWREGASFMTFQAEIATEGRVAR